MIITDIRVYALTVYFGPIEAAFSTTDAVIGAIFDDVPPDSSLEIGRQAAELTGQNWMRLSRLVVVQLIDTSKANQHPCVRRWR